MVIEPVEVPTVRAVAVDPAYSAPDMMVVVRYVHLEHVVADHLPVVALCVQGELQGRGCTVEDWEVTFDLWEDDDLPVDDPAYWWRPGPLTDDRRNVTCPDCKEWTNS